VAEHLNREVLLIHFQGLGEEGLRLLRKAGDTYGLLVVTEVLENSMIDLSL
jgi:3-deoxy-7-phosphoheptulonate synthase